MGMNASNHPKHLVIFGATGGAGRALVQQALAQGHPVTAFVRDPARLDIQDTRLKIHVGDATDLAAVRAAVSGHDAVICALGVPARSRSGLRARGTECIVAAMQAVGVRRLIVLSSHGVAETREELPAFLRYIVVPLYLSRVFADHEAQEQVVRGSNLDWTLVRPPHLTNGPATGDFHRGVTAGTRTKMKISRADVAAFMLAQLDADRWLHCAPTISY